VSHLVQRIRGLNGLVRYCSLPYRTKAPPLQANAIKLRNIYWNPNLQIWIIYLLESKPSDLDYLF